MFRLGGSTSGITSGLDTPKRGRVDGPGGYAGIDYDKIYGQSQKITDKYYPRKGGDINRFLIDWGLNMVGNAPTGNVLQTAAKQAQGPTKDLFASMDQRDAMRAGVGADIFGKMVAAEGEMLGGEGGAKWRDQWALGKVKEAYKNIYLKKKELKKLDAVKDLEKIKELEYEIGQHELDISQLQKDNPLLKTFAGQKDIVKDLYDAVTKKYENMMEEVVISEDNINDFDEGTVEIGETITRKKYAKDSPELVAAVIEEIKEMFGGTSLDVSVLMTDTKATGGRVGLNLGGLPNQGSPTAMANAATDTEVEDAFGVSVEDAAPEVDPVGMSYEELRARLPATITDEIVILLSQSAQALEDFATIQTQQDVDNFNTKYNVNLVLPSEG
jgi:hypothetical protein